MRFRTGMAGVLHAALWAAIIGALLSGPAASAAQGAKSSAAASQPSFSTTPALDPAFAWGVHDYAIRCGQDPVNVQVTVPAGWEAKLGLGPFQTTDFVAQRPFTPGGALTVTFHRLSDSASFSYHVRCLPADFPVYRFGRTAAGGPEFFMLQMDRNYVNDTYAAIFDRNGVPVWWYKTAASPIDAELLSDGTVAWAPWNGGTSGGPFEIRTLDGQLVRTVGAAGGLDTDIHDLQLLPNGNYLLGGQVQKHVDASPYGGSTNATVTGYQIQELTPDGQLVWKWDSLQHIGLGQTTTRWWDQVLASGRPVLDIQHWNAVEPNGKNLLLSFRHLDAVYAINRTTGAIVWKLGGIHTSKSLKVLNDPDGSYPLAGQHDPRVLPDGTISIFDNFTGVNKQPRVVRYRINAKAKTATLVQSFTDRTATRSICCGSARMLPSGDWLVGWGGVKFAGAYNAQGRNIFRLQFPGGFSYRSFPVPPHALTAQQLRQAMNAMNP